MTAANVLIVDDDPEITRAISFRLKRAGLNPIIASDGRQGLDIAREAPPDAIVLDLRMPVMDGFELLERLQNSVHTRNIPAIIVSAESADRARLKALRGGATFFIEKPYNAQDLIEILSNCVERRQQIESQPFPTRERTMAQAAQQGPQTKAPDTAAPATGQAIAGEQTTRKRTLSGQEDNRRVLIADDDPSVVRALAVRCRKLGLEVETAENGLQAILKASRNPPRLLILDINMPEADGFRVCEWMLDPQRPPVDVVMLTGRDDSDTLARCDSFGAFYVPKNHETWETIKSILSELLEIEESALEAAEPNKPFGGQRSFAGAVPPVVQDKKKNTILIVDDDTDLTRALERRLSKCGAETMIATNGIDAYRLAVKERPAAIIADYVMPEGGGHYLLWRLKSTEATKDIPIIMMSGQSFEAGTEYSMERDTTGRSGAVKFFKKPLDTNELFKELAQHCEINYIPI